MSDKFTDNQLFNLISGNKITGESTYAIWKSLGNEGTAQDFLNYLKDDGESNVSEETLAQIEKNKNDISQLTATIDGLSKGNINISNYGLTAKDRGNGIVEILLTAIASSGVTQSGNVLTIIDGITVTQSGSTLAIA